MLKGLVSRYSPVTLTHLIESLPNYKNSKFKNGCSIQLVIFHLQDKLKENYRILGEKHFLTAITEFISLKKTWRGVISIGIIVGGRTTSKRYKIGTERHVQANGYIGKRSIVKKRKKQKITIVREEVVE